MILDSLLLFALTKELKTKLLNAQVRQIHQTDARVVTVNLFTPGRAPTDLVLSAQNPPYLYATAAKNKNQYIEAKTFCMTLRKHLENARLSDISQIGLDRIVEISFDRIEKGGAIVTKKLYVELIPSAPNLILTEENRILDVLVRGKKQHRDLAVGAEYVLPEGSRRLDFTAFSAAELADIFRYGKETETTLGAFLFAEFNGLSSLLKDDLCRRADLNPDISMQNLTEPQIETLTRIMAETAENIREAHGLYVTDIGGKSVPTLLARTDADRHFDSVSDWIAETSRKEGNIISVSVSELKKQIKNLIKKEERKLRKIGEEMEETKLLDTYLLYGNLLSIYAYEKPAGISLTVDNPFDEAGGRVTIPIEPEFSVIRNSQNYFKKYNRMKTRLSVGREKMSECETKLQYLQNAAYFADTVRDRAALDALREELKDSGIARYEKQRKKQKQKEKEAFEPEKIVIDGFTVYIGKNSRQNEYLTLKKAEKTDVWFHAKEIPGSHVVIAAEGGSVPSETKEKVAALAAYFSRGKNDAKVDIDCTLIKYVKKIPNAPSGLVSYTHHTTLTVVPTPPENLNKKEKRKE